MSENKPLTQKQRYLQFLIPKLDDTQIETMIAAVDGRATATPPMVMPAGTVDEKNRPKPQTTTPSTEADKNPCTKPVPEKPEDDPYRELMNLIGCENAKQQLTAMIADFRMRKLAAARGRNSARVSCHQTHEAPFTAEHILQKFPVGAGPLVADVGKGGHGAGGAALLDREFKGTEIQLTESLLVDPAVDAGAGVGLLIVQNEVLNGDDHAMFLRAADGGSCHHAGEDGIFGVILNVSAALSGAVEVHGRRVPDLNIISGTLGADMIAQLQCQIVIPGGGHHHLGGISCRGHGNVHGVHAGRAVQHTSAGNTQPPSLNMVFSSS